MREQKELNGRYKLTLTYKKKKKGYRWHRKATKIQLKNKTLETDVDRDVLLEGFLPTEVLIHR